MAGSDGLPKKPECFKALGIRGVCPTELNEEFAYALGEACGETFSAKKVVIGHYARVSSPELACGLVKGLNVADMEVATLGLCGTEEIYHAAATGGFDLGIMITGSHNPADQNGFKFVRAGAVPVSAETGLNELARRMKIGNMAETSPTLPGSSTCGANMSTGSGNMRLSRRD